MPEKDQLPPTLSDIWWPWGETPRLPHNKFFYRNLLVVFDFQQQGYYHKLVTKFDFNSKAKKGQNFITNYVFIPQGKPCLTKGI